MNSAILTILMLVVSNVFMTLAWYGMDICVWESLA